MDRADLSQLLRDSLSFERRGLRSAIHPQVIAGHQAAIRDFEHRLRELEAKSELMVAV